MKKLTIRQLSIKGDTVTTLEESSTLSVDEVMAEVEALVRKPNQIVAVNGMVYGNPAEALDAISVLDEAEVILAPQIRGG